MRLIGTFDQPFNLEPKIEGMLDARMLVPSYADLLLFTETNYLPNGFLVSVIDEDVDLQGIYQLINNTDLSNPDSWIKIGSSSSGGGSDTIIRIIDRMPVIIPEDAEIHFINEGDSSFSISSVAVVSTKDYAFPDDTTIVPITFTSGYFYAINPDGLADADRDFMTVSDALAFMGNFNRPFMADYKISNGNIDVNIKSKNLIVAIDPTVASTVTSVQVLRPDNSVIYSSTLPSTGLLDLSSVLLTDGTLYKVVIASTSSSTNIYVEAGNKSITKVQNFTSGDSDNSFTSPIRVAIQQ